jgi:hypothetical protein
MKISKLNKRLFEYFDSVGIIGCSIRGRGGVVKVDSLDSLDSLTLVDESSMIIRDLLEQNIRSRTFSSNEIGSSVVARSDNN